MKLTLLSLLLITNTAFATDASNLLNRMIILNGNSQSYGPFSARLEIRQTAEGIKAIKEINYKSYRFEKLNVQEIWTGEATLLNDKLIINYQIRAADFLKSAEGEERTPSMFKEKIIVQESIVDSGATITLQRSNELIKEKIIGVSELPITPLWENKRTTTSVYGAHASFIENLAMDILKLKVFNWFHSDPKVKAYENHPEYQSKKQYFVYDFSDYDFYQKNKNTLRVVNKIPDTISLVEDVQRRNAYAYTLDEKAKHFDDDMQDYHINELGLYSSSVHGAQNEFLGYSMDGDGALWTGMYLATQSMRYQITKDPAVLENVKKSLNGLMLLMDITGDPHKFARNAQLNNGYVAIDDIHHLGTGENSNVVWLERGNNDMFKGVVHGFIWAYHVLPDSESELREKLLAHMQRIPDLDVGNELNNRSISYGLRALATKSEEDKKVFMKYFNRENNFMTLLNLEGSSFIGGIADWSGINLGMVGNLTQLLIAKAIFNDFPSKNENAKNQEKEIYLKTQKKLLYSWKDMLGTRSDFLTVSAYAFAVKEGVTADQVNELRDGFNRDELKAAWDISYKDSLNRLVEIPVKRSEYNTSYDYFLRDGYSISWWPTNPWKSIQKRKPVEYHMQGAINYPLFEGNGIGDNFIWKSGPFDFHGGSYKQQKQPGADYLYVYWMAKMSGIIK